MCCKDHTKFLTHYYYFNIPTISFCKIHRFPFASVICFFRNFFISYCPSTIKVLCPSYIYLSFMFLWPIDLVGSLLSSLLSHLHMSSVGFDWIPSHIQDWNYEVLLFWFCFLDGFDWSRILKFDCLRVFNSLWVCSVPLHPLIHHF